MTSSKVLYHGARLLRNSEIPDNVQRLRSITAIGSDARPVVLSVVCAVETCAELPSIEKQSNNLRFLTLIDILKVVTPAKAQTTSDE
jgi:hypothetical protein